MKKVANYQKIREKALLYAEHGFKIVPVHGIIPDPDADYNNLCTCGNRNCDKPGKHPRIRDWQNEASNDPEKIISWFEKWPDMNFGVIPEGTVVIDIDRRNGGYETINELEKAHGKLPETVTVETGDGKHLYFSYNGDLYRLSKPTAYLQGIDIKTETGYVMGAGSLHHSGKIYNFSSDELSLGICEIEKAPQWLLEELFESKSDLSGNEGKYQYDSKDSSSFIHEGERNNRLTQVAGRLWNEGKSKNELLEELHDFNRDRCRPKLDYEELLQIANSITAYPRHNHYPNTDLGNSKRFLDSHNNQIRYCSDAKAWYLWNGTTWKKDRQNKIQELGKKTAEEMEKESLQISNSEIRDEQLRHARKSQGKNSIKNMIELASSDSSINVIEENFDKDLLLLNVKNGTVDLRTGKLLPPDPKNLITKTCNVKYNEFAECPKFLEFLDYIFDGNKELIDYIQKLAGYCLTGSIEEQIIPILYGNGNNGKSTFMKVMEGLLGDYCISSDISSFSASGNNSVRSDLARMKGSRLVLTTEFENNQNISEALVKKITGGEKITCRYLYSDLFEYTPTFKVMMATNHRPEIKGTDEGIWRRIHLVPFTMKIADKDRKKNYADELLEELPGILLWCVNGCLKWRKQGLAKPSLVENATKDYREDMDELGEFIDVCCQISEDERVMSSKLYSAYEEWCNRNGIRLPLKNRSFSIKIKERGFKTVHKNTGNEWQGIGLKDPFHIDEEEDSDINDLF